MGPEASAQYVFFGCLLASFAALMAVFFFVVVRKKRALRSWAAAAARVTESEAVWGTGTKGGRTWVLRFTYQYEVGGRVYRGRRTHFFRRCTGNCALELAARHPVGGHVQVYYDPARPAESVLNREIPHSWILLVSAFLFAALSVIFFKLPAMLGS